MIDLTCSPSLAHAASKSSAVASADQVRDLDAGAVDLGFHDLSVPHAEQLVLGGRRYNRTAKDHDAGGAVIRPDGVGCF